MSLADAIASLHPRQQKVIVLCYVLGLIDREVGEVLGVTRERARQVRQLAVWRLRKKMRERGSVAA